VSAGLGNIVGQDGTSLVGDGGAGLIGQDGSSLRSAGGGMVVQVENRSLMVPVDGGLSGVVAGGAGNLIPTGF
jgi:hypothetical protein